MTDLIIFGVLFATYAVLQGNTFGGPSANAAFQLANGARGNARLAYLELHLRPCDACGTAGQSQSDDRVARRLRSCSAQHSLRSSSPNSRASSRWATAGSGAHSFRHSLRSSARTAFTSPSGFSGSSSRSSRFKLRGLTPSVTSKLTRFTLFWHFLDIVWIFIFTMVYLMGHTI